MGILFNTRLVILENFQLFSDDNPVLRLGPDIGMSGMVRDDNCWSSSGVIVARGCR